MRTLLLSLVLVFVSSGVALADRKGGHEHGFFSPKNLERLDLTAEQRDQLEVIRKQAATEREENRKAMRASRKSFREKLASDASEAELREAFTAIEAHRAEVSKSKLERMLKVRAILTPEQRKKAVELMGEKNRKKHKDCPYKDEGDE